MGSRFDRGESFTDLGFKKNSEQFYQIISENHDKKGGKK